MCNTYDVQDKQHVFFSLHPSTRGLSLKDLCVPIPPAGFNNVSAFLGQENNKLHVFLMH